MLAGVKTLRPPGHTARSRAIEGSASLKEQEARHIEITVDLRVREHVPMAPDRAKVLADLIPAGWFEGAIAWGECLAIDDGSKAESMLGDVVDDI